MDTRLKKPIAITGALVVLFIIILLISNGNVTVNVFSLVVLLALIALVWFRYLQANNLTVDVTKPISEVIPEDTSNASLDDEDVATRTGAVCEKAGVYVCKDHPKRKVNMKMGNRFPPCRGDKKGHSAIWILKD
jgi:hypothetical protein